MSEINKEKLKQILYIISNKLDILDILDKIVTEESVSRISESSDSTQESFSRITEKVIVYQSINELSKNVYELKKKIN